MKNKKLKRPGSKKKLLVLLIIPFLIGGLVASYFVFVNEEPATSTQKEQLAAEQADVDAAKQKVDEQQSTDEPLKDNDSNNQDSPAPPAGATLSNLQFSQGDGLVNASADVSGAQSGTCSFIFTDSDGRAITKTANLNAGKCAVTVPEAEFTMIGQYNLTVKFGSSSLSKTVNIS